MPSSFDPPCKESSAARKTGRWAFFGSADQGIPMDDVQSMKDALAKAGSKSQIHVYDGAPHAFHADYRPTYRKEPAEDGWKRLLAWLRSNGV